MRKRGKNLKEIVIPEIKISSGILIKIIKLTVTTLVHVIVLKSIKSAVVNNVLKN